KPGGENKCARSGPMHQTMSEKTTKAAPGVLPLLQLAMVIV
ncbi:MAG: hypothetical protein ACI8R4_000303, partial [Paracoccaceae bacterium]